MKPQFAKGDKVRIIRGLGEGSEAVVVSPDTQNTGLVTVLTVNGLDDWDAEDIETIA